MVNARPGRSLRSSGRIAVLILGIPTAFSVYLRVLAVLNGTSTWAIFGEQMRANFIYHASVVGTVLLILWIAARSTSRESLTWRIFGPALGGLVLTVGWLEDVSSNGLTPLLESLPANAGLVLWILNTVLCLRWWGLAGATAPEQGPRSQPR